MHELMTELQRYLLGAAAIALGVLAAFLARGQEADSAPPRVRWGRIASAALVAVSAAYVAYLCRDLVTALWIRAARRDDMARYFVISRRALADLPLYWPWPDYGPHFATPGHRYPQERFPYPPFLLGALVPLANLPLLAFARAWYVVVFAGFVAYAACLARLATGRITAARVVVATAVLAAVPGAQLALMLANVEPVLWALFGAALAFPAARGFGFTASAMVKLYGAWPLLAAVWTEGRRVLRGAALALALGFALGCVVLGPGVFLRALFDWARYMLPVVGQGTFAVDTTYGGTNVSLSFAVLRAVRHLGWEYQPGPLPAWARLYLTAVGIAAPLLTAWLTRKIGEPALRYALVTIAAVLFAPLCWATYLPLLLAPLAIVVRLALEGRAAGIPVGRGTDNSVAGRVPRWRGGRAAAH